ncbi:MAG: M24 family metallopeptidase [Candidatus Aminicenantes bacterium]|nr:MAG: M24 family metallopeptidase [Candidatus Aminicenantes bacterium]
MLLVLQSVTVEAQEARRRWEIMNQIRRDKFDIVLPRVMKENKIDMWITVMREGNYGPLYYDLGGGYVSDFGYYIFFDRGDDRIERIVLGIDGYEIQNCGAYDLLGPSSDLKKIISERDPKRIGVNMSERIGAADSLTHTCFLHLVKMLGKPWADRFVSAEKLVSDFRSRRVASEIVIFGQAGEISREIAERALSNEVITPGITALEDVAWWIRDQLLMRGLEASFGLPSIYITGPDGIEAVSSERIIQRGDLIMIDWGVGLMNFYTDMKRMAYVLKDGEIRAPSGFQNAFDQAVKVREVIRKNIKVGLTAEETLKVLNKKVEGAGFSIMKEFNKPTGTEKTEVIIGCHSVGNWGHGIGPSIAWFNPLRMTFRIQPTNMFVIEFFAYTAAPEWGGKKLRVPLEDDAIVTDNGIEWLYPIADRILLIR